MFRARLASVIVAAGLAAAASGCSSCFEFRPCGLFGGHRDSCCPREGCCPAPGCCDGSFTTGSSPVEGPVLSPEQFGQATSNGNVPNGNLPLANQPRLKAPPQSAPTPYTP